MTRSCLDISATIDSTTAEVLAKLHEVLGDVGSEFFVIGAAARDRFQLCYDIDFGRLTEDVDVAVKLGTWGKFDILVEALSGAGFENHQAKQRMTYQAVDVDIVPFGEIAGENQEIRWPPESAPRMSVLGMSDAFAHSDLVRVTTGLEVRFASCPGLAALKLIAYEDRKSDKDAIDFAAIAWNYLDFGNDGRLREEHADLMEPPFDYELAGARLLGRDMAEMASESTSEHLNEIFRRIDSGDALAGILVAVGNYRPQRRDEAFLLLEQIHRGLGD